MVVLNRFGAWWEETPISTSRTINFLTAATGSKEILDHWVLNVTILIRSSLESILVKAASVSRVFVICTPKEILNVLLKILSESEHLDSREFVFIFTDLVLESFQENQSLLVDKSTTHHLPSLFVISWTNSKLENLEQDKMEPIKTSNKVKTS